MTTETIEKNYQDYTFKKDEEVVISGEVFTSLFQLLQTIKDKEVKVSFNLQVGSAEEYFNQTPLTQITELGFMVDVMLQDLFYSKVFNIDNGKGILQSELDKPQLELVK